MKHSAIIRTFANVHQTIQVAQQRLNSPQVKLVFSLSSFMVYLLFVLGFHRSAGLSITAASIIPTLIVAWLYGARAGAIAGLFTIPLNILLYGLVGFPQPFAYLSRGGFFGSIVTTLVGLVVGRLSDLTTAVRNARNELEQRVQERTADLARVNEELEQSLRVRDQFLANTSHELRTPLNAIMGFADILALGMEEDVAAQQKMFRSIKGNGQRLLTLINGVLDLAKIEAGQMQVLLTMEKPHQLIHETIDSMRSLASTKDLILTLEVLDDVPEIVQCDALKVQQIVTNLVGNAIKFTTKGSITVRLSAKRGQNATWSIAVTDTGIGMPETDLDTIFDPFKQMDGSWTREHGGTGLGLTIVKQFLQLLDGRIDVQSQLNSGSTFTVVLPQRYDAPASVAASAHLPIFESAQEVA